jgi:hypothetical protein
MFDAHTVRRIAVESKRDPRSVRRVIAHLTGEGTDDGSTPRPTVVAGVVEAATKLGLWPADRKPPKAA